MMELAHPAPATPIPLFVAAAAVPAVAVPCPVLSTIVELPVMKFHPGTSLPARSGCEVSTPESIMPMVIEEAPLEKSQALGASRDEFAGKVRMRGLDAGIDHADGNRRGSLGEIPSAGRLSGRVCRQGQDARSRRRNRSCRW